MASANEVMQNIQIKHYLSENLKDLSQVYVAHKQSLSACEEEIIQWKKFIKDYNILQEKLTSYPDKTSYDEIIPLGSLAYMKGRKIHTNEILVHFGENWFAERSVKDAIDIIARRKDVCKENLKCAERLRKIHEGWLRQSEELAQEKDTMEILEKISEEEYERDKEKHQKMVAKHITLSDSAKESGELDMDGSAIPNEMKSFEDLLKRLDLLEEEESIKDELIGAGECKEEEEILSCEDRSKLKRRVSWANNLIASTDEGDEDEGNEETHHMDTETAKIKYRTRQQSLPTELISAGYEKKSEECREGDAAGSGDVTPQTPSDIYKMIVDTSINAPPGKGILKKKSDSMNMEADTEKGVGWSEINDTVTYIPNSPDDSEYPARNAPLSESPREIKNLKQAFSYKIVPHETDGDEDGSSSTPTTPSDHPTPSSPTSDEPKKVSRFKAARMKKSGDSS